MAQGERPSTAHIIEGALGAIAAAALIAAGPWIWHHVFGQDDGANQRAIDSITTDISNPERTVRMNGLAKAATLLKDQPDTQEQLIPLIAEMIRTRGVPPKTTAKALQTAEPDIQRAFDLIAHQHGTDKRNPNEMINPVGYVEPNLSGAYLGAVSIENGYLAGADLSRADLSGAYLDATIAWHADLTGSNFTDATLITVDLTDASARATTPAGGPNFTNASLTHVTWDQADLDYPNFDSAIWGNTGEFDDIAGPFTFTSPNFAEATLVRLYLDGVELDGANFNDAHLWVVGCERCSLDKATFTRTHLRGVNFHEYYGTFTWDRVKEKVDSFATPQPTP